MKLEIKEVYENYFSFSINGEDIGNIESHVDEFGIDNWIAIDDIEGITAQGKSKQTAAKNLYKILQKRDVEHA